MLARTFSVLRFCNEVLTGEFPFTGHNAIDVIGAILHKETPPIDGVKLSLNIRRIPENASGGIAKSVTGDGTG